VIQTSTQSDVGDLDQAPIAREVQRACVEALGDWAKDRQGLGGRLAASSWLLYNWTRRSASYMARQARGQWGVLPFVSPPRKKQYGGIGKFLFSLTKPGRGHNVYTGQLTATEASAELTVPAARGLNFARNGGIYLDEWGRLYPADEAGITPRIERMGEQALQKAVA
jgi:hypothetical protein